MFVGQPGQLGPVGDEDDLLARGQETDALGDLDERPAADARVDLVEEQGRQAFPGAQADHGQQEARKLAARGDAVQGLWVQAGVGHPQEAGPQLVDAGVNRLGAELHQDTQVLGKTQLLQLAFEIPGQIPGRGFAGGIERCRGFAQVRGGPGLFLVQTLQFEPALVQKGQILLDFGAQGHDGIEGALQFALQLLQLPQAFLDLLGVVILAT